ncbi:MAG: signal peptide peptidase SppA, partial [Bacteroidota bacterium]
LNPVGGMEFNGFTAEISFYKKAMEKLEVEPMVFRVGDFKSAVEPYILDKMSEENREQINSFLNSIHNEMLSDIAKSRKIDKKELERIADENLIQMPEDAKKYKLVDKIAYFDELEKEIKKELDLKEKDKVNYVTQGTYDKVAGGSTSSSSSNRIAVIIAAGEIRSGKSEDESVMGSATIVSELRKARKNKRVKAVVLRINSPGGSALASDVVWNEIQLTRKEKPVIASMSDYAASGGYYLAMGCDKILAKPTTITGSIGVFLLLFDVKNLFENKLGITTDRVSTGNFPELRSVLLDRELKEEEKVMLQASADKVYDDFTKKAAEGRKMSQEEIKAIASGRVWTGTQAKENGLVDELGGLEAAIALAAKEAELEEDDYRVRYYPAQKSFVDKLL